MQEWNEKPFLIMKNYVKSYPSLPSSFVNCDETY